jgi:DNA (cytosine-5)-methyltransferase 1
MKILELFSGYGTASFALKRLGIPYELVGYSDIDKYANQCFKQNHCPWDVDDKLRLGDVTKINPFELEDFDLLTGGFPCQAFSAAGKGQGELDPRGTLFNEIIRIAEVKKPKYMLLENVKGFTFKKFKDTFNKVLSELDRIGYTMYWKVLNSKDFGIPQNRERVWFVCFRKDLEHSFSFPKQRELYKEFKDLLLDLPFREIPKFQQGYYCGKKRIDNLKSVDDKCYHTLTINRTHANQYLLNKERDKCRLFNKIESFRLMGFLEDEINLEGLTDNQAHRLAGNGQDVNMVSLIFTEMRLKENDESTILESSLTRTRHRHRQDKDNARISQTS